MTTRSTTSQYYPPPPGKVLIGKPAFRRGKAKVSTIQASSSIGVQRTHNLSTAPLGRKGSALTGYSGNLVCFGNVAKIVG